MIPASPARCARFAEIARKTVRAAESALLTQREGDVLRERITKARALWDKAGPLAHTRGATYLAALGLARIGVAADFPPTLRFFPRCWNQEAGVDLPAILAAITDAGGTLCGVQRIWLRSEGVGLARLKKPRLCLGMVRGGHVVLAQPQQGKLVLAESVESALAFLRLHPGCAAWACLAPENWRAPIPPHVTELVLATEGEGAIRAENFHASPGRAIRIMRPPPGLDYAGWWREAARLGAAL